jgi:hypothetical protein
MIRRRRPVREIAFSFDSFLDVVANVVGIIIRLILVVWVGARSYSSLKAVPGPGPTTSRRDSKAPEIPKDPLQEELARHREELARAQAQLLEQLRQAGLVETQEKEARSRLGAVAAGLRKQAEEKAGLERTAARHQADRQTAALSLDELRRKSRELQQALAALQKQPRKTQVLRYHTPVSKPVDGQQIMFECRHGRVAFIDIAALKTDLERNAEDKVRALRSQGEVQGIAGPFGAFRLRYTIERERGIIDLGASRIHLSKWEIEPVTEDRGETEAAALAAGSAFHRIVDFLDPRQHVVTIFVYPDSFALFRRLRDYLYDRDLVVAGNPWAEGRPITFAPDGFRSRGQ